eukprot:gene13570-biopygen6126
MTGRTRARDSVTGRTRARDSVTGRTRRSQAVSGAAARGAAAVEWDAELATDAADGSLAGMPPRELSAPLSPLPPRVFTPRHASGGAGPTLGDCARIMLGSCSDRAWVAYGLCSDCVRAAHVMGTTKGGAPRRRARAAGRAAEPRAAQTATQTRGGARSAPLSGPGNIPREFLGIPSAANPPTLPEGRTRAAAGVPGRENSGREGGQRGGQLARRHPREAAVGGVRRQLRVPLHRGGPARRCARNGL